MLKVVLDTNALFYPFQFKIDLEEAIINLIGACDMLIPDVVVKELISLRNQGNKFAGAALRYADRFGTIATASSIDTSTDDAILATAIEISGILVTSDRELIEKAKDSGVKVIFLRGRQKLELWG